MIESIKYNLANLGNFSGRDSRPTFWWYVLFLFVVNFVIGMVVSLPMAVTAFSSSFEAVQSGVDPENFQASFIDSLTDSMRTQMWISVIFGIAMAGLLAASFVRRLHDSGKPGWIALIAIGLYVGSLIFNLINLDSMMESMRVAMDATDPTAMIRGQTDLYAYSAMTYIAYLIIIIFGVFDTQRGANQYGDEPDYN